MPESTVSDGGADTLRHAIMADRRNSGAISVPVNSAANKVRQLLALLLLVASPLAAQDLDTVNDAIALRDRAQGAQEVSVVFLILSQQFPEDIQERRSPFLAAAAAHYCAEYNLRALASPNMARPFRTVAANLAYDAVAESADAAELGAEMAGMAKDPEVAEQAASLSRYYFQLADTFHAHVLSDDRKQAGQRLLRAMHAADRADRWVERLKKQQ